MKVDTEEPQSRRADAMRNRARVLEAAFEVFGQLGTSAPMTEIATRAGVGPGTIYRHFPTKQGLLRAVVSERFGLVADHGRELQQTEPPGAAFFSFLRSLLLGWDENRALADAIISSDLDLDDAEGPFLDVLGELLAQAQQAGSVRADVTPRDIKALLAAGFTVRSYGDEPAERFTTIVFDGLRPATTQNRSRNRA